MTYTTAQKYVQLNSGIRCLTTSAFVAGFSPALPRHPSEIQNKNISSIVDSICVSKVHFLIDGVSNRNGRQWLPSFGSHSALHFWRFHHPFQRRWASWIDQKYIRPLYQEEDVHRRSLWLAPLLQWWQQNKIKLHLHHKPSSSSRSDPEQGSQQKHGCPSRSLFWIHCWRTTAHLPQNGCATQFGL